MCAVMPISLKYNTDQFFCSNEVLEDAVMLIFLCTNWKFTSCEVKFFPVFQPNDYLWKTHASKGKEQWEIDAWAVREMRAKESGFKTCDKRVREKL